MFELVNEALSTNIRRSPTTDVNLNVSKCAADVLVRAQSCR